MTALALPERASNAAAWLAIGRRLGLLIIAYLLLQVAWLELRGSLVLSSGLQWPDRYGLITPLAAHFWEVSLFTGQSVSATVTNSANVSGRLLGWSLGLALVGGLLGTLVALGLDRVAQRQPRLGHLLQAVIRLPALLSLALPLFSLGLLLLYAFLLLDRRWFVAGLPALTPAGKDTVLHLLLPVLTLTGLPAMLVAGAAYEHWRRGAWLAGLAGALAGIGRGAVMVVAALPVIEWLFGLAGAGRFLITALHTMDVPLFAALCQCALLVSVSGHGLAILGDGLVQLTTAGVLAPPPAPAVGRERIGLQLAVASLLIPLVLLLLAWQTPTLAALRMDFTHSMSTPDSDHPLGTDKIGRDNYTRALVGLRGMVMRALLATALALMGGLLWGVSAAALAHQRGELGAVMADLLLLPAWLTILLPLIFPLLGWRWMTMHASGMLTDTSLPLLVGMLLLPRVALVIRDLWPTVQPWRWALTLRLWSGLALLSLAIVLLAQYSLDVLGFGIMEPTPSLGTMFQEAMRWQLRDAAWWGLVGALLLLTLGVTAPCLAAGWLLLRPVSRLSVLSRLLS